MKFLLDVHFGLYIAKALAEAGHDVVRAALAYPTASDARLQEIAIADGRVLVTEDSDSSDLIFAHDHSPPPSLIYIRCEPFEQAEVARTIMEIPEGRSIDGHVVVVTASQVRIRPFPKGTSHNG